MQSFFTSAAFRLLIADFSSILRDLLAHAAGDVADTELATDFAWVSERHTILFHAGKLLSQDQLSAFLRFSVNSELLREDTRTDVLPGSGPMSIQGREVLSELRNVIQVTLQIGIEGSSNGGDEFVDPILFLLLLLLSCTLRGAGLLKHGQAI